MRKMRKKTETECWHKWIPLLGRAGKRDIPTALFTCLKCGEMKVGKHTIRISSARLDMGGLPLYAGNIELGENKGLVLDAALSADGKYCGIIERGTAGAALVFGNLCYFQTADSRWEKVDANLSAGYPLKLGMCVLAAAADGNATKMLLYGKINAASLFPTLTKGAPVYMSETAGAIVVAQPTTANVCIRVIGYGNTADELFFYPSPDYITHI